MKRSLLPAAIFLASNLFIQAQVGTWTQVTNLAPHLSGGAMQLLSDGTILCKSEGGGSDGFGNIWDKLTPDANGGYINGTWSSIAPMTNTRLYFSTQVLKDGRLYVAGGEYGTGGSSAEVYNPATNTWSAAPAPGGVISDANSVIMPDGRVMQAMVNGTLKTTKIYNPTTNSYIAGPTCIGIHNESSWVKQGDNSVLFVDRLSTNSERYIPATNTWTADATVPVNLYDPFGDETGPALLLPDGRSFYIGSTGKTAYYTPSGTTSPGSWAAGPTVPSNNGATDAPAANAPNGIVLCVASPTPISSNHFPPPTTFYEFNYLTNTYTALPAPPGVTANQPCYIYNLIVLPDGKILLSEQDNNMYWIYTPSSPQLAVGTPTVSSVIQSSCTSFTATGMLFNGISEGACYGDDWQMATNYPIIRLTKGSNVYYARTFNWNSTGLRRGTAPDSTQFTLPPGLPVGTYSLQVIANGFASQPVPFTPFPILTTTTVPGSICSNTTFTYNATSPVSGATFIWTRPSVAGISNAAITTPQSSDPNEILINTTPSSVNVNYVYTITANGCSNTQTVSVTINPSPTISISGTNTICLNANSILTASGALTFTWSTSATTNSINVTPTTTTVYSVTGTNTFGCMSTQQSTITVNPLPTLTISGTNTICINDSTVLSASGGVSYVWSNSSTNSSITITPTTTVTYSVTGTNSLGCSNSQSVTIVVNPLPSISIAGTSIICLNDPSTLTASGASTYTWNTTSTSSSITVSPTTTSVYSVTGTDLNGCNSTSQITVSVNPLPVITVSGSNTICLNQNTTLTANGGNMYLWNTSATSNSIIVTPVGTTTYSVKGTDVNGCSDTDSIVVTVNPLPTLTITPTTTICTGNSISLSAGGASTYTWSTGANTSSINISPAVSAYYSVTGSDVNGCTSQDSVMIAVDPCAGISELQIKDQEIIVYPNPAQGNATLYFSSVHDGNYTVNFIDIQGKIVKHENTRVAAGQNSFSVDLKDLQKGFYFILIQNTDLRLKGKLIIE